MWKIKTFSIITLILGLISLVWITYDYFALTDIVYKSGGPGTIDIADKQRIITLGFIPVILFHFAFFALVYLLFNFLRRQKIVNYEFLQLKAELEKQIIEAGKINPGDKTSLEKE